MKLSTKGRYAVIAMIELALNDKKGLLPLAELSLSQNISISYLEQLFSKLRGAGLVAGVRGPRGGYRIAKQANEISIAEIVSTVDKSTNLILKEGTNEVANQIWSQLSSRIYNYLNDITLEEAIASNKVVNAEVIANDDDSVQVSPQVVEVNQASAA
ncbi:Iron-sulfur cluster regulator IscR [hydrothermal vent metagenome]|uniref:Iron-sulfur cluster regulator IscR n=1 Tax=hydrothermal vent metagenome TaxID=652676 RepID=A0A3B0YQX0_9ZZZZ